MGLPLRRRQFKVQIRFEGVFVVISPHIKSVILYGSPDYPVTPNSWFSSDASDVNQKLEQRARSRRQRNGERSKSTGAWWGE